MLDKKYDFLREKEKRFLSNNRSQTELVNSNDVNLWDEIDVSKHLCSFRGNRFEEAKCVCNNTRKEVVWERGFIRGLDVLVWLQVIVWLRSLQTNMQMDTTELQYLESMITKHNITGKRLLILTEWDLGHLGKHTRHILSYSGNHETYLVL